MAKSQLITAIDVGSSKIATILAQVRQDEPGKIHIIGTATSTSAGVRKGQIVNIEEAVECILAAVEAAERMAGFNVGRAYVSVGGAQIGSQNSQGVVAVATPVGEITPEDVRRVLEAAKAVSLPSSTEIIHVLPRSFTVDGQDGIRDPVGMTGVRLEVATHIVTGAATAVRNLTKCVTEVGCDVAEIVFNGLAASLAVLTDTEKELGVIVVDIGGGTTAVAVWVEGALAHSAVLPVGAKNVTNDLAIGLRISLESAEKIKLLLGDIKNRDEDEVDLNHLNLTEELKTVSYKTIVEGIIRPRLNEIFQLVAGEVKQSDLAGLTPAGVVVTGGGAGTVGVVESAKRTLSSPVRVGYPTGTSGLIDDIDSPAYAAAVGLLKYAKLEADQSQSRPVWELPFKSSWVRITTLVKSLLP